ncbi:MAG: hypothetical protein IJN82_05890, partial [Clostridia bacterium]|nr:hypothetical protein [Clostridia bacterium]
MRRTVAILLILCLAVCGMTACKSKDDKKAASAGGYVEGAPEDGGDNYEIIGNQGGGNHVTEDNDVGGTTTPDPDPDTDDGGNTEQPGNQTDDKTDDPQTPVTDGGEEDNQKPEEKPNVGGEEDPDADYKAGNKIKILDYNLRYTDDPDGRSIIERALRLEKVIATYSPDICGFQEIVPTWVDCIGNDYPTYENYVYYRATNNKEG